MTQVKLIRNILKLGVEEINTFIKLLKHINANQHIWWENVNKHSSTISNLNNFWFFWEGIYTKMLNLAEYQDTLCSVVI
jgi:hypothetical protein